MAQVANAQYWLGLSQDNHCGVLGVHLQPASIASSQVELDVLVGGVDFSAINLDVFGTLSAFFSEGQIPYEKTSNNFLISGYVQLPSLMWKLNDHSAFSLTTSLSGLFNTQTSDGSILDILRGDLENQASRGFNFSDSYVTSRANVWLDIGGTYAYRYDLNEKHALSAGATLKFISGIGGGYLNLQDLALIAYGGQQEIDVAQGRVNLVVSDRLENLMNNEEVQFFSNPTFGASFGMEYFYKGNSPLYKIKVGVSITDLGSVRYSPSSKSFGANANIQNLGVNTFSEIETLEDLSDTIQGILDQVDLIKDDGFRVSLPTKFNIQLDYHIGKSYYISGGALLGIVRSKFLNVERIQNIDRFYLSPRLEKQKWGIALLGYYDNETDFSVGLTARYKFIFLSVNNLLTGIIKERDVSRMNVAAGIRIFGLK